MREKSPQSNLRKRLLILRKKLERTASFPKKLFLGISPRRLILRLHSLRAAPNGAASKPLLPPTKNHEVQFGAQGGTRTPTPLRATPPQGVMSTNFNTCADKYYYYLLFDSSPVSTGAASIGTSGIADTDSDSCSFSLSTDSWL